MSALDLAVSGLLTLVLHATALLGAVWFAERAGALRHAGWAEFAWRAALFGALLSTSVQIARWSFDTAPTPTAAEQPADAGRAQGPAPATAPAGSVGTASTAAGTQDAATRTGHESEAVATSNASKRPGDTAAPTSPLSLPQGTALALLAGWLLAIAVGAVRFLAQALAIRRLARHVRRHGTAAPEHVRADADHTAAVLDVAAPSLHVLAGVGSPMLLPGRRVVLPAWVAGLDTAQRRALLAHEFAHLQRHDPALRVVQRVAALPLAFHPLAWHALSRLEALAEDACDARAARAAGSGRPLAECLAACLAHAAPRRAPVLAVAMADRPGPVVRRVRNLLEKPPMSDRPVPKLLRRTAIALGLAAAILIPGVAVTTFAGVALADRLVEITEGTGSQYHLKTERDGYTLEVRAKGEVTFNDAETDVVRLGRGARFSISEETGDVERELRVFGRDGAIQREFRIDGDVVPFDAEAKAWFAKMLPKVIRETGLDADARGQRILARGGTPALLAEIAAIEGDYARGRYFAVLFEHATLDAAQTARAIDLARGIESDFELRRVLQAAAEQPAFADASLARLLDAASSIDSDFELAELLTTVAEERPLDATMLPAWRKALATIDSDFEHRRVLDALLERGKPLPGLVVLALDAAADIGSDFERRQVLEAAAPHVRADAAATAAWFRAAAKTGSDFERRSALETVIEAGPVDIAFADHVLQSIAGIGSDFEARQALVDLAARMPDDVALRERYRAQARRLGDFERGEAEKALDRFVAGG